MNVLSFLLVILNCVLCIVGRPVEDSPRPGPVATIEFLKNFGYLERSTALNNSESEAIYSEISVRKAITVMQKFGGLEQTGIVDDKTLKLLSAPRCGLPDVIRNSTKNRSKRFAIVSKGWNKRRLTFGLENYSPKLGKTASISELQKAFNVWSPFSALNFTFEPRPNKADIRVSFAQGYHGDSYPFDGRGRVLAHAFYPTHGGIHFDEDEDWWSEDGEYRDRLQSPIKFSTVSVHEIGHSLGLGHSSDRESIMFPYYQDQDGDLRLGQDDIYGMYELYVKRHIPDGDEDTKEEGREKDKEKTTTEKSHTTPTTTTKEPWTTTTVRSVHKPQPPKDEGSQENENEDKDQDSDNNNDEKTLRNLCNDQPTTKIAFLRNEIFVFRGQYMWRFSGQGQVSAGSYPVLTSRLFPVLTNISVDAAYERESDSQLLFFSGNRFWTFNGVERDGNPQPLTALGLPDYVKKIDAAFVWGKNHRTYFFSDNLYWRYNDETGKMDEGYPLKLSDRWNGVPENFDSVICWKNGKTYFFKKGEFWRFDDISVRVEEDNFPLRTKNYWFGC